jgi:uncharacterized protein YjbJ (UPF0337 family)
MSEEHIKGGLEKMGGRIKEAAGALIGDEGLKTEGPVDQVKGGAHQAWGDVKDAAKDLADRVGGGAAKGNAEIDRDLAAERDQDPLISRELP